MSLPAYQVILLTESTLRFLDQTLLPHEVRVIEIADYRDIIEGIKSLRLRGAPLIGVSAAYGIVVAARALKAVSSLDEFKSALLSVCDEFIAARPTAVNLSWAVGKMKAVIARGSSVEVLLSELESEAREIHEDDARRCRAIGAFGSEIVPEGAGVLTHCNTGALATGGEGTAFSVLLHAHRAGKNIHVYACETRPLLQGARLTMWELQQHGIPATLITNGAAASLMQSGRIQCVITGADRIAANGDSANKIGTLSHAVNAKHFGIPFFIAAPLSTVDFGIASGAEIPIEERAQSEVTSVFGTPIAPEGSHAFNPAFDVTPNDLIVGIITEKGIARAPFDDQLARMKE